MSEITLASCINCLYVFEKLTNVNLSYSLRSYFPVLTNLKNTWKMIHTKILEIQSTRQYFDRLWASLSCVQSQSGPERETDEINGIKLTGKQVDTGKSARKMPNNFTFQPYLSNTFSGHLWSNSIPKVTYPHNLRHAPRMFFNFEEW